MQDTTQAADPQLLVELAMASERAAALEKSISDADREVKRLTHQIEDERRWHKATKTALDDERMSHEDTASACAEANSLLDETGSTTVADKIHSEGYGLGRQHIKARVINLLHQVADECLEKRIPMRALDKFWVEFDVEDKREYDKENKSRAF